MKKLIIILVLFVSTNLYALELQEGTYLLILQYTSEETKTDFGIFELDNLEDVHYLVSHAQEVFGHSKVEIIGIIKIDKSYIAKKVTDKDGETFLWIERKIDAPVSSETETQKD